MLFFHATISIVFHKISPQTRYQICNVHININGAKTRILFIKLLNYSHKRR